MLSRAVSARLVVPDSPAEEEEDHQQLIPDSDEVDRSTPESTEILKSPATRNSKRRVSRFVEDPESDTQPELGRRATREKGSSGTLKPRNSSGSTLVPNMSESTTNLLQGGIDALDMNWKLHGSPQKKTSPRKKMAAAMDLSRRKSGRLNSLVDSTKEVASSLGKRSRDVFEQGLDKVKAIQRKKSSGKRLTEGERLLLEEYNKKQEFDQRREQRTLHIRPGVKLENLPKLPKGWSYNVPDEELPPSKRVRVEEKEGESAKKKEMVESDHEEPSAKAKAKASKPKAKKWLSQGLYVGQKRGLDPKLKPAQNNKKLAKQDAEADKENRLLPLPMFAGESLLERGRNFKLPFDVFCPLPAGQPKPEEWKKIRSNRFFGDAALYWAKQATLPVSWCDCSKTDSNCGDSCINRALSYECNADNCNVGLEKCTNRAFATLKDRYKKGTKFEIGVEVLKTDTKGFGVRACRMFDEDQIILEYAGEIITEDECQRRMKEDYKDAKSFYLMEFDQGMIIDATKGSMARFVNHSCRPNCEMRKWIVDKKPRMALFALREIMTGEELTYDYNFEPTGTAQPCHCGADICRGVIGPRTSKDKEREKQRANEEKAKNVEKAKKVTAEKKKQVQPPASSKALSKPTTSRHLEKTASEKKGWLANAKDAVAGTKRKFKEMLGSSAPEKVEEEEQIAKAADSEARSERLKKRQRISEIQDEEDIGKTPSQSASSTPKKPQHVVKLSTTKTTTTQTTQEKRITSTSTGGTTLVEDSDSALASSDALPSTNTSMTSAIPESVTSQSTPRKSTRESKPTEKVRSPDKPKSNNEAAVFEVPDSQAVESPEHKGAKNPWVSGSKTPAWKKMKSQPAGAVTGAKQGTLNSFLKKSSSMKKVTESMRVRQ